MNAPLRTASEPPRRLLRSAGAVLLGFVAVVALSLGTDQLLHVLKVYPPWGQPMTEPHLNLLALAYRCAYAVLGSYLALVLTTLPCAWLGGVLQRRSISN